jgi:hypothetical protein
VDPHIEIARIQERIGAIDAKADAAHKRMDSMDALIRSDIKDLVDDIKTLMAWMNHKKGHDAAMLVAASAVGGVVSFIASKLF